MTLRGADDELQPTRVRHGVLGLVCSLSMITYLDRVCFGAAAPRIVADLGLSGTADLKWAFTLFAVAYGAFEIPAGRLGDRLGPRGTLLRIVLWWSVCTALTGVIGMRVAGIVLGGLTSLIVLRFLFGAGEAGAYPNITRAVHNWFPPAFWETAQGLVWMSGRLMGGLTPLVWAVLVEGTRYAEPLLSWRGAFLLFGVVGLGWCVCFARAFRNRPEEHPHINRAELRLLEPRIAPTSAGHGAIPWRALATNRSLAALCVMYMGITYGWYFNITYLASYLQQRYQPPQGDLLAAVYQGGPLWVGALGCAMGGVLVRRLSRRCGDQGQARRILGVTALLLCAGCWTAAIYAPDMHLFFVCVSAGAFLNDLTMGACWATCQDLGGRHAGVTAAWMNTTGTIGAALAGWVTGTIVQHAQQSHAAALGAASVAALPAAEQHASLLAGYDQVFVSYATVYAVAAFCWLGIDPKRKIEPSRDDEHGLA